LSAVGGPQYEKSGYWPADLHLVGKEIIRFHAVYWPAFLMAAGLPIPKQIWAHGWLLMDSAKMSKSLGNVVRPRPIVHVLGLDALRYYLLRETVFGADGNFSYDALVQRYNSDLANGLGNLASRTAAMITKDCGGRIPRVNDLKPQDQALAQHAQKTIGEVLEQYNALGFSKALEQIWSLISAADKYLTTEQPWALKEADKERRDAILATTAEVLRIVTALTYPVLPESTTKVWALLGQTTPLGTVNLESLSWGQLKPGTQLGTSQPLFPRIDKAEAIERMEVMENEAQKAPPPTAAPTPAAAPAAPAAAGAAPAPEGVQRIGIEDFVKVEMRVGQIKTAERIVGADKLLKLTVDIGTEIRQICAGIAQFYEPEKLIDRKVVVVTNLAPRKLRGVESNGMIVAASIGPEGRPVLAGFAEDVEVGARLK
jgi:methionyl-tRNA synthetase